MTNKAAEQKGSYDILIWADESGRILAKSLTILGKTTLSGLVPGPEIVELHMHPSEFFRQVPNGVRIGLKDIFSPKIAVFVPKRGLH